MSVLLQSVLAGVLVAAGAVYSAWRLLSPNARLRLLDALGVLPAALTTRWLTVLRRRTLARLAAGCAGCAGGATPAAAARPNQTPGALRR
jgi:ABC-type uncharacterized transport system permease subunit